ncbi:hypothetical protein DKM19_04110 [Streptosporangium sp. 'caverna']|nr:hypothetical protein DKM19_04110 [Streptosporangium sp. 'caverna']
MTRRLIAGAVVTAGFVTAAVIGPSLMAGGMGGVTSYASSAIEIKQEDGEWVARIKDPLAEYETYAKAFSAVGLKVQLELVPVSPSQVGDLVLTQEGGIKPAGTFEGGLEPEGCKIGEKGCHLAFRVPIGFEGEVRAQLGRAAEPGESYQSVGRAAAGGEMLEGFEVHHQDRTVAEVLDEMHKRGLRAVYQLVKSDPNASVAGDIDGRLGVFSLSYEPISADAVGSDWLVWEAQPQSAGVIRLVVTPEPLKPVVPGPLIGDGAPGS